MKLHTKYQKPGPSGFRQEQEDFFFKFSVKNLFVCDLAVQWTETI